MKNHNKIRDDAAKMCKVDVEKDEHSVDIKLSLDLSQLLEAVEKDAEGTEGTEQFYHDLADAIQAGIESAIGESEKVTEARKK